MNASRGHSITEYVILLGVVAAAVVGMQFYAKRGIQAGIKVAADRIGSQVDGMVDRDLSLPWKSIGTSVIHTKSDTSRNTTLLPQGSVMTQTDGEASSQGVFSSNAFSRDQ